MDKLMWVLVICSVIFILSYDPKSGMVEKFKNMSQRSTADDDKDKPRCCGSANNRAHNQDQCESSYFQSLQFATPDDVVACPVKPTNEWKGAIF